MAYDRPEIEAKRRRVTLRLDKKEHDLVVALVRYRGEQLAAMVRQMLVRQVEEVFDEMSGAAQARPQHTHRA